MKLAEINALRGKSSRELEAIAREVGVDVLKIGERQTVVAGRVKRGELPTADALRLAIIDAVCDAELSAQRMADAQAMRDAAVAEHEGR